MFVVIFEVQPKAERWDDYWRPPGCCAELERIDGFLDNERFRSERTEGQCSRSRRGVTRSRWSAGGPRRPTTPRARRAGASRSSPTTTAGRRGDGGLAAGARRLRGSALRHDRGRRGASGHADASSDQHDRADGAELRRAPGLVDHEWFASLTTEGKRVLLASWTTKRRPSTYRPDVRAGRDGTGRSGSSATTACATVGRRRSISRGRRLTHLVLALA